MKRILLVEDSADVLSVLQLQLELMGYVVDALLDARSALATAQREKPDVIVSDLGLPGMDGIEFMTRVRATPHLAAVPAIALTGAVMDGDIQRAISVGFTAHLCKPVEAADLGDRIEQLTAAVLKRKAG